MSTIQSIDLRRLRLAPPLCACSGQALALDELTFGTNWVAEPEHGGFYQAAVDGTYEKYGLKVTIVPKADQAMLLGGKIQFYMQGNLLGTFSAVEQDVPVMEVAAMFQKDPQIIMAHPESGLKAFGDLAKLKYALHRRRPLRHRLPLDDGGLSRHHRGAAQAL